MAELDDDMSGLGLGSFADMVEVEDVAQTLSDIELEAKETGFGNMDIQDFRDFNTTGEFLESGHYGFNVEARHLLQSTNIMKLIGQIGAKTDNSLKLTIFTDRLKLSAYSKVAFAEDLIKLTNPAQNVEEGHEVAFVFDGNTLASIAKNLAGGGIIQFVYNATGRVLNIKEGNLDLSLSTKPAVDFAEFHKQIGTPQHMGQFDPLALQSALLYMEMFSQRNDTHRTMGIINVDPNTPQPGIGRVYGGGHDGIGVYETKGLKDIKLRIPNPAMKPIYKIAAKMHPDASHMFVAGKFIIFRDHNLYLGFELTEYAFPPVNKPLEEPIIDKASVTREQFLNALVKLSVVNAAQDTNVTITITGIGQNAEMHLKVLDSTGKPSSDRIGCTRDTAYSGDLSFDLTLRSLGKTIKFFKTENVILMPTQRSIFIRDQTDDFQATSILTIMDAETKARIAEAKQAEKKDKATKETGISDDDVAAISDDEDETDDLLEKVE